MNNQDISHIKSDEEIARLIIGLNSPMINNLYNFFSSTHYSQTKKEIHKIYFLINTYTTGGITSKILFDLLYDILSLEDYISLVNYMSLCNEVCTSCVKSERKKETEEHLTQKKIRKDKITWTDEENKKLEECVKIYGPSSWTFISDKIGSNKSASQCYQHWHRVINPLINKEDWNENEEEILMKEVVNQSYSWSKICKSIPHRTDVQCKYQYQRLQSSLFDAWTKLEEESLLSNVKNYRENWVLVSKHLYKHYEYRYCKSPLQCKKRYNLLKSNNFFEKMAN